MNIQIENSRIGKQNMQEEVFKSHLPKNDADIAKQTQAQNGAIFTSNLSGNVTDQKAYNGQGKTKEDIQDEIDKEIETVKESFKNNSCNKYLVRKIQPCISQDWINTISNSTI